MEILSNVFDYILNDLGSIVFLPILMLFLGLLVGMRVSKSLSSAVTFGVALAGMSLIVEYMTGAIGPAAEQMTKFLGTDFSIIDGGWITLASITWSWPYAFILFPIQLIINAIMFITKKTNTINVDLWNVWGKIFQTIVIAAITGSILLGLAVAVIRIIAELIMGDALQARIQEKTGIPGVTAPHSLFLFGSVLYPLEILLRKVRLFSKHTFDAQWLKNKIGIFSENHIMGFIMGFIFGLLARYNIADTLTLAFISATAMTLLPMVTRIFMQALSPISDACSTFMRKRLKDDKRELNVGLDTPFLLGNSEIWVAAMISVPFTLIWAVILPWNNLLPFAGVVNLALAQAAFYVCNGNLVRMLILMIGFGSPVFLLCGTAVAPMISDLAIQNGIINQGTLISNSALDAPVFTYAFSFIWSGKIILPAIAGGYWIFGYVMMIRDLKKGYSQKEKNLSKSEISA